MEVKNDEYVLVKGKLDSQNNLNLYDKDGDFVIYIPNFRAVDLVIKTDDKVTIPEFIAEWIEECNLSGWHLQKVLSRLDDYEKVGDWAYDENDDLIPEKVDMVAHAWLFGYSVEQERLYTVEFPTGQRLYKNHPNGSNKVVIVIKFAPHTEKDGHFTKRELEDAGFGWVFDCDGVSVKEVSQ